MPVSTRSTTLMRLRWPPSAEGGAPGDGSSPESSAVTLPAELYWKYVLPFTPVQDRIIINRRSKSTQFCAGNRVDIDAYLRSVGGRARFPRFVRDPGSASFPMAGRDYYSISYSDGDATDLEKLRPLREARDKWDAHLSMISSPSERLQTCLCLLAEGNDIWSANEGKTIAKCPLLIAGDGTIRDAIRFHASMDASSIQGPPGHGEDAFPNTLLGYWAGEFLNRSDEENHERVRYTSTENALVIVEELLRAGADTAPFLSPLESCPPMLEASQWSMFYPRRRKLYFDVESFEPGRSILGSITATANARQEAYTREMYADWEMYADDGEPFEMDELYENMYDFAHHFVDLVEKYARRAKRKAGGKHARCAKKKS